MYGDGRGHHHNNSASNKAKPYVDFPPFVVTVLTRIAARRSSFNTLGSAVRSKGVLLIIPAIIGN